ncbi:MAG: tRNA (adenosine(37)-N6)-dimethylallyltransferase MiaA [Nitrospira sp.]|nr:tRNA (adenosine(37)-N6)-dimethylallyltransferase MiaA [Nitrospira sp.]
MITGNRKLIVILGPTGVGKSLAAVMVAEALGGEIISADSRQIYRGMDIATAKPGPEVLARVPHHLLDVVEPDEIFSAGRYSEMARQVILRLYEKGRTPVVVGGTGLYIRALLYGLWQGPQAQWDLRDSLLEEERTLGPGHLHQKLVELDPESALRIHPADLAKTIRALEVVLLTGIPLTQHHEEHRNRVKRVTSGERPSASELSETTGIWQLDTGHCVVIGLRRDREDLYRRINHRVEEMVSAGLVQEVERLLRLGYHEDLPSMLGLGYRQMVGYLKRQYSLQETIRLVQRDTRRFAKRQMTWFRKEPHVRWIDLAIRDEAKEIAEKVLAIVTRCQ